MLSFVRGNIFDSQAGALVNTVNCVGVMGKGIAYQFRRAYPQMYEDYVRRCRKGEIRVGEVSWFFESGKIIINFPTKSHWRARSRIEHIQAGLVSLRSLLRERAICSVAIPPLGCGNGGLSWRDVRCLIDVELGAVPNVAIEVYEPVGQYESRVAREPVLSVGHFILAALRVALVRPTKINMQKAAYFFNVFWGQPFFKFTEYRFGPYSTALDPMFNAIRDFVAFSRIEVQDLERVAVARKLSGANSDRLSAMLPSVHRAAEYCNERFSRIEALATVHAVIARSHGVSMERVVTDFFSWSTEKEGRFTSENVRDAVLELEHDGLVRFGLLGYEVRPPSP